MKNLIYYLLVTMLVISSCDREDQDIQELKKKPVKVPICHYDAATDTWKTLNLPPKAAAAHLKHGDFNGDCSERLTYVPDDVFEGYLIELGYDDVLDDYVLTSNINTVEDLEIPADDGGEIGSILDMTGIEGFTALKSFFSHHQAFTSLNLSGNLQLVDLNLFETYALTGLDLSHNTALTTLSIDGTTLSFESLDLSSNSALTSLYLQDMVKLISLNLQNGNNMAMSFDVNNSPDLICILVDDPVWSTANWPADYIYSLDCALTYVPDDAFENALIFWGYDNIMDNYVLTSNINTVELLEFGEVGFLPEFPEGSPGVQDFTGIEDFIALKFLYIRTHYIANLNLSSLAELANIGFFETTFSPVDLDLSNNLALTTISLIECYDEQNLDLSNNSSLVNVTIDLRTLQTLNLKNGNNMAISFPSLFGGPSLTCIQVDDAIWSTANWTDKDAGSSFSEDCSI